MEHPSILDPKRVQEAFAEASLLPVPARADYLMRLRGECAELADEVESLLTFLPTVDPRADSEETGSLPVTLLGKVVGGCRIERLLGFGGMSAVYAAWQESPPRRVAVKIVRRERIGSSARRRLRIEAEALGRLEHPNIARVFLAGSQFLSDRHELAGSPYIVMELIDDAVPINGWANEHKLDARARIELAICIAEAIGHAHRAGVIHRDIKPGNILVGSNGVPKVIDFGIASVHDSMVTAVTEGAMGTLAFMSPEQARGHRADTRSDVWGLGAVLFDLLTGVPPFDATDNSLASHVDRLLHDPPALVAERARELRGAAFADSIPHGSDAVLRRALANDAELRYRSATEFADELRRLLKGEPLLARPDSEWAVLQRLMRRHRVGIIAASCVLTALAAGMIFTLVMLSRERDANRRAQWSGYVASIAAASSMLERNDASAAREMLDAAPNEHRGWEWSALRRLSGQSKWAVSFAPGQQVYDTDWSIDGGRIIAAASGNVVAIDCATQREVWRVPTPSAEPVWRVRALADGHVVARMLARDVMRISPDGTVVARAVNDTLNDITTDRAGTRLFANDIGGAQELDPVTLEQSRSIQAIPPMRAYSKCIAAAPDASFLVLGGDDGAVTAISSVDGVTRWVVDSPMERDSVRSVAVSRDGARTAAASRSGLTLIDSASGSVLWRTTDTCRDYRDCTFSHDGRELIGSNWNESIDRYDAASGALIASITGAYSQVWNSAVSPDGSEIASGTFAARVELFDARADSRVDEWNLDGSAVIAVAERDGSVYATTSDGGLFMVDVTHASTPTRLAPTLHANDVCVLHSGEVAVAHDAGVAWLMPDGEVRRSTALSPRALRIGTLESGAIITVHLEDERVIAIASGDGALRWSVGGFNRGSTVPIETALAGKVLLPRGVGIGGDQKLLDTATMRETPILPAIEFALCGTLSPDRTRLAIGSVARAGEVALVDATSFELLAQLSNHRGGVRAIAWSPDGSRLASASADGTVRIWHVEKQVEILTVWRGACADLAWGDDDTLCMACADGKLRAMRVAKRETEAERLGG